MAERVGIAEKSLPAKLSDDFDLERFGQRRRELGRHPLPLLHVVDAALAPARAGIVDQRFAVGRRLHGQRMSQRVGQNLGSGQYDGQVDVAVACGVVGVRGGFAQGQPAGALGEFLDVMTHDACRDRHLGARVAVFHAREVRARIERDGLHKRHFLVVDFERSVGQFHRGADRAVVERALPGVVVSHHPEFAAHEGKRSARTQRDAHFVAVHAVAVVVVVVAAGVAFVDDQPIGRLYPYVDARRDEFLGRGLQRRAIETVGYLVVFPGVVVIAFGHLA